MFEARSREIAKKKMEIHLLLQNASESHVTPPGRSAGLYRGPDVTGATEPLLSPRCALGQWASSEGVGWEEPQEAAGSSRLTSSQRNTIFIKPIRDPRAYGFLGK